MKAQDSIASYTRSWRRRKKKRRRIKKMRRRKKRREAAVTYRECFVGII